MRPSAAVHDAVAALLEYPREDHAALLREQAATIAAGAPDAATHVERYAAEAASQDLTEREELFVRTFDVNAERALEVGWQVFGEQYARGVFLAKLRGMLAEHGVAETTELPDHLTQVLRLLGRVPQEDAHFLIARAVRPAVRRIRADLGDDHAYAAVLDAVAAVVALHGAPEFAETGPAADVRGTWHNGAPVGSGRAVR